MKVGDKVYFMNLGFPDEGVIEEIREVKITVYGVRSMNGHCYGEHRNIELRKTLKECHELWK